MKKIALSLLKKPHLLCSGEFIYKYKSAFNRIAKKIILSKNAVLSNDLKTQCVPSSPILRLTGIAVLEEYSRLGIGKQLLSSYEKVAKDRNYKSIILETPRANIKAIRFYEKLGWRNYDNENGNLNKAYFYKSIIE
jgi:GNAT superfamily N-acetyltransferase